MTKDQPTNPAPTGKRPRPGRPVVIRDGRQVAIFLDPESLETARALGDGNVSAGIRRALALARPTNEAH